ncbi:MAG: SIMPL domain-containing protein [Deltaproteobacteria bacterium]|nr:SIMPL domain-containing protein [Candidatus Anaeroferrophillus wilburensis]MBN2890171.1 SIMPL domain-containing protein [Deltaproteobacteria bacterium]
MGPYITVSGFAEEWIDPDVAVWTVSIETDGKELKDLKRENDDEYERVLDVARALDVPTQHTTSGRIGVRRVYETDNHGRPGNFSHFQLTRQVKIEQHDIDRFEEFLDKLLMDGDLNVQLNYNLTTMGEVRERLKLQATYAARSKAEKLAAALGASVGGPLIVSEYPIITDYAQVDRRSMQAGMVSQSTPERIHVTEHIYVRFALLHGKKRAEKP